MDTIEPSRQFDPALWTDVDGPIHIYVHVPFCPRKCRFCFYYTVRSYTSDGCARYVNRVLAELREYAAAGAFARAKVQSVYLGGGTPTVIGDVALRLLLDGIRGIVPVADGAEVTVEAFPEQALFDVLPSLGEAGVNRLSLGVQTLDDEVLTLNRRDQVPGESVRALRLARSVGLDNVNIDLMYGLPGQSLGSLRDTMAGCLAQRPAHITAYRCVIGPGTAIFRLGEKAGLPLPTRSEKDELGEYCMAELRAGGYQHYAVDHFATDERYRSRHELGVWRGENFLGLGASGFSHLNGTLFRNKRSVRKYLDPGAGFPLAEFYALATRDRMRRWLLLGLTKLLRADAAEFWRQFGSRLDDEFGDELDGLARHGWLARVPDGVSTLTQDGVANMHALSFILPAFGDSTYEQMVTGAGASRGIARDPSGL
jgi:oxygen-independent coproporphyrinogen-3 oxidase